MIRKEKLQVRLLSAFQDNNLSSCRSPETGQVCSKVSIRAPATREISIELELHRKNPDLTIEFNADNIMMRW